MNSVGIFTMVMLLVFFGMPVLYVWKTKHRSRSLWKMSTCFIVIVYGTPFVGGMILASLAGVASQGVEYVFQINHQASVPVVRLLMAVVAVLIPLPGLYVATKLAKRPLAKEHKADQVGFYPAT